MHVYKAKIRLAPTYSSHLTLYYAPSDPLGLLDWSPLSPGIQDRNVSGLFSLPLWQGVYKWQPKTYLLLKAFLNKKHLNF